MAEKARLPGRIPSPEHPVRFRVSLCWQVSRLADFGPKALRRLTLPGLRQWI